MNPTSGQSNYQLPNYLRFLFSNWLYFARYTAAIPSLSGTRACHPSIFIRVTSKSFCDVPSGLVGSKTSSAAYPTTEQITSASSRIVKSSPHPIFTIGGVIADDASLPNSSSGTSTAPVPAPSHANRRLGTPMESNFRRQSDIGPYQI